MATLQRNTGVQSATGLNPVTTREIVRKGDATVITPGTSGFDTVRLASAGLTTAYEAATANAPIRLGCDQILFEGLVYPEKFS